MSKLMSLKHHKDLFKNDEVLSRVVDDVVLPGWKSTENVFHDIMSCIIEQQIHYRSSKYIFQHLMQEAGLEELDVYNFHLLQDALSKTRLSEAKYEAITHTLHFFRQNTIPWTQLSDDEVRLELKKLRGIGRWTVDMVLLYTLRRPDVFPYDDYHLTQVMSKLYGLNPKDRLAKKMMAIADQWQGCRSLGVLYLLAWKNQNLKTRRR